MPRQRLGASCTRCLTLKARCNLSADFLPAQRSGRMKAMKIDRAPPTEEFEDGFWPPRPVCEELVSLYFDFIHDKHHSIFRQPSFMEALAQDQVPEVLVYAMMALAARFSKNALFADSHPWERGRRFARKCKDLLEIRDITLTTVQACILLGTICYAEAEAEAEALYYAIANRLALMLNLLGKRTSTELERQLNLRVWWTLFMIDIWSSAGVRLPRQMDAAFNAPSPWDEETFLRLKEVSPLPDAPSGSVEASPTQSIGIWAQMARLTRIFDEIHDLNELTVKEDIDQTVLQATVVKLGGKLENWLTNLPSHMRMSPANLASYGSKGLGGTFAALHLGYHHYNQLLYINFRPSTAIDPSVVTLAAIPGCECLYIMVGHMLVVSSTVHIRTLLFSPQEDQISSARSWLERNFEILMRLQQYWPNLELSLSRLRSFHNACRTSMDTSFRMDQWMLRFLLEHGNVVGEKFKDEKSIEPRRDEMSASSSSESSFREWYLRAFEDRDSQPLDR